MTTATTTLTTATTLEAATAETATTTTTELKEWDRRGSHGDDHQGEVGDFSKHWHNMTEMTLVLTIMIVVSEYMNSPIAFYSYPQLRHI